MYKYSLNRLVLNIFISTEMPPRWHFSRARKSQSTLPLGNIHFYSLLDITCSEFIASKEPRSRNRFWAFICDWFHSLALCCAVTCTEKRETPYSRPFFKAIPRTHLRFSNFHFEFRCNIDKTPYLTIIQACVLISKLIWECWIHFLLSFIKLYFFIIQ